MTRVTVLASSYPRYPGDGTAPFVQSICEGLAELGHDVSVVAPYDPAVRPDPQASIPVLRFRYAPVEKWHIMGHAKALAGDTRLRPGSFLLLPAFLLAEYRATLAVARRQRAEVIHAHWALPNGLVGAQVAQRLGVPLALSLHGSDMFVAMRYRPFGRVAGYVLRRAAVITACSPELQAAAVRLGADPARVHLVPWGADPTRFHPAVPPLGRRAVGIPEDGPVIAALGRLVPKKGFAVLIQALPGILKKHPAAHLVIGGMGQQQAELAALAERLGVAEHLHLPGAIPWQDVAAFLTLADVFVVPSVRDAAGNLDGLPTVLLEAMAAGRTVVATRLAGMPLVIEHGHNGLLCEAGAPAPLAQAINCVLDDPGERARLGRAARAAVEQRFNWREVARCFTALFGDL